MEHKKCWSGKHYVASNVLLYTYYIKVVHVEDMIEGTGML
jgi:hypothetical protein